MKQQQQQREHEQSEALRRDTLTRQNSSRHWDQVVSILQKEVAEFSENFPRAKSQQLHADLLKENNLTIRTVVQPILKVEVLRNYPGPGVHAEVTRQKGWDFTGSHTPYYQFTPEGFTDGSRLYSPEELAASIFQIVSEFFAV